MRRCDGGKGRWIWLELYQQWEGILVEIDIVLVEMILWASVILLVVLILLVVQGRAKV